MYLLITFMKKYTLFLALGLFSSMALAQSLVSGEVTQTAIGTWFMAAAPGQYYAPLPGTSSGFSGSGFAGGSGAMSWEVEYTGEIRLNIPFDASSVEEPLPGYSANNYQFPEYNMGDATKVKTGPESLLFMLFILLAWLGVYHFKFRKNKV